MEAVETALLLAEQIPDPLLPLWAMELIARVLFYAWLFALGGTVGSFLNVVVYRLPRGKNLAVPGSSCPHCDHPIRLSDNIPIISWLALGGRCRDCHAPISPRYLLVEALVAATFLVVLAGEYFLPAGRLGFATRPPLTPYDGPAFWGMYGLHLVLVVTIFAAVLIAGDGFHVPRRLYLPALITGLVLPLPWPHVRSLPANPGWHTSPAAALIDGLAGLLTGALLGSLAWLLLRSKSSRAILRPRLRLALLGASVGVVFGWQRSLWMVPLLLVASTLAAAAIQRLQQNFAPAPPPPDDAAVETKADVPVPPDPESISEEVHIVSPPMEPTEPS